MSHPFMQQIAANLYDAGIGTLRFQFPFMEAGKRRPDTPAVAQVTVRAAVAEAQKRWRNTPVFTGGKSFGGRRASHAQADAPMTGLKGIAFLGFPLHPADKPSTARADHLTKLQIPLLFIQGTRDKLANPGLLRRVMESLGPACTIYLIDVADHGFHIPKRTGRNDDEVVAEVSRLLTEWIDRSISPSAENLARTART